MSNPLVLLPFIEESGSPKYTGFVRRQQLNGLNSQATKTAFQVLGSVTGKGYLDRAFINAYWSFYNGHWLRFRVVADGVTVYDHLVDTTYQSTWTDCAMGVAHGKYSKLNSNGNEVFIHPNYTGNGTGVVSAVIRPVNSIQLGMPPAITAVIGNADAWGVQPIAEPIYFNSSLSIEVSMASGSYVGSGALVISGGLN
jgi:hypothetical protein